MDLRQRKRIINQLPKFDIGDDARNSVPSWTIYNQKLQDVYNSTYPTALQQKATQTWNEIGNVPKGAATPQSYETNSNVVNRNASFQNGFGKAMAGVQAGLSMFNNMQSSLNVKSQDQLQTEAGSTNQSVLGVSYDEQNAVDGSQDLKEQNSKGLTNTASSTITGAATGAKIGGPWGAAIGGVIGLGSGLFGWLGGKSKLRKRIRSAKINAAQKAQFQRASAMTTGLQNQYALRFGDTSTGILYS